jgi:hypothetical protein
MQSGGHKSRRHFTVAINEEIGFRDEYFDAGDGMKVR